jgi:hypothetical protein
MPHSQFRPDLMGNAVLDVREPLTCGDWASVALTYTAGHFGIDDSGSIKISFRSATDQTRFQLSDPIAPGYISITTSNGSAVKSWFESNRNIRPWHHTLYIQCSRFLSEGDAVHVRFGDRSGGGPGFRVQTFVEHSFEFRVYVDAFATYDYVPLPDAEQPTLQLVAGPAQKFIAILPTLRDVSDPFTLGVKAEDRWGNPTDLKAGTVRLVPSRPVAGLPEVVDLTAAGGVARLEGLRVATEGVLTITLQDADGVEIGRSNPLLSRLGLVDRHYWSDLHGQSEETVGTNSAREYFQFARDRGLLDICGHQGNDFQITDTFWRELGELTREFDEPGRFLAIPGYEWSGNTSVGGDHNVWYRHEGRPIYRSQRALVPDDADPEYDCLTAHELFDRLRNEEALVVAHVGGRYADVGYAHDAELEPSVEVHSAWGSFEWIVQEALARGYRIGIVGGSDGHKGRPGASYPGASKFGSYGGLTCHLLPELNRDALFASFRARHHYATTGCRPVIELELCDFGVARRQLPGGAIDKVDRATMGDILELSGGSAVLRIRVVGHAGVERIELWDGSALLRTALPDPGGRRHGHRLRIQCEGAEYKGRGRLVTWEVAAGVTGTAIQRIAAVNFWNPDRQPQVGKQRITWTNVTTGGHHAVDVWLKDLDAGRLEFASNQTTFDLDLARLPAEDCVVDCGGLGKRVRVQRLPDAGLPAQLEVVETLTVPLGVERRVFAKVVFEDGHMAWTSPVYLRGAAG